MTKMQLRLELFVFLTMVPVSVLALPMATSVRKGGNTKLTTKNEWDVSHYPGSHEHLEDRLNGRDKIRSLENSQTVTKDNFLPYSDDDIKEGIKSFQSSFGIEPTETVGEHATKIMQRPRSNFHDKGYPTTKTTIKVLKRRRRYVKYGGKWLHTHLYWKIHRASTKLPFSKQMQIMNNAFKMWEYSSPLRFTHSPSLGQADIVIQFVTGNHGDNHDFDGPGKSLAHAFGPQYGGDIHFDDAEPWGGKVDLLYVAVHEIGHAIGLGHSNIYNSIMYGTYTDRSVVELDYDDKAGINSIYGPCDTKLDGVAGTWGYTFFFRGDLVWKINDFTTQVVKGFPKKITDVFCSRIPTPVDTVTVWTDYRYYFLIGKRSIGCNRYTNTVDKHYDNNISYDWPGIPNDIDASISYRDDKVTYLFKGSQYWKFDDDLVSVATDKVYPRPISADWPGIPTKDIDAAFYSKFHHKTFFFKGIEYWVFDYKQKQGYPGGLIRNKWKGICSAKY